MIFQNSFHCLNQLIFFNDTENSSVDRNLLRKTEKHTEVTEGMTMFHIPEKIRFLKTHHNGDATLEQDALLTSKTNIQWQKIFDDLLLYVYNSCQGKNKRKNPNISFQKDVIDFFHDHDAVEQRIAAINYYLSDRLFKNDFDYCEIKRC